MYCISSIYGGCQRCVSYERDIIFFRMYLPLALEVYNISFIDSSGFMSVGKIKKHLLGLTLSNILTNGFGQNEGQCEHI